MPNFHTQKQVRHSAAQMYDLVADIESYPQFLPMCEALTIRSRREREGNTLLVADMTVGYKLLRESFTTQVYLQPAAQRIDVHYVDGPFKYLENRWQFLPLTAPVIAAGHKEQAEARPAAGALAPEMSAVDNVEGKKRAQQQRDLPLVSVAQPETAAATKGEAASAVSGRQLGQQPANAGRKVEAEAGKSGEKANPAIIGVEAEAEACRVDFYIDYAFKNPLLAALMGTMFDIAFRKFTAAFETRADTIYGIGG